MDFFSVDIKNFYTFKKSFFVYSKNTQIFDYLLINNILLLDNTLVDKIINDVFLIERLSGIKFYKFKLNYKNLYVKNKFLSLTVFIQFKLSPKYINDFIEYFFFNSIIFSFVSNVFDLFFFYNSFKKYYLYDKLLFLNIRAPYDYFSLNNKRRYLKIIDNHYSFFEDKLWLNFFFFFKQHYFSIVFFNFIENLKLVWRKEEIIYNEET